MSFGAWLATRRDADGVDVKFCRDAHDTDIGGLIVRPYAVHHDAREPLQYVDSEGNSRLGIPTDAG